MVAWLISCLGYLLGFCPQFSLQQIIQGLRPGGSGELQRLLLRPPLRRTLVAAPVEGTHLVKKLAGLVSIKGEDILLQSSSEQQVKYQRLRASVPAKLWRWKTIARWSWTGSPEHINVLELRNSGPFTLPFAGGYHSATPIPAGLCTLLTPLFAFMR